MRRPKPDRHKIQCHYFSWVVSLRDGIYYADGRGNSPKLGRFSLGASTLKDAQTNLELLDRKQAVKQGLADKAVLISSVGALSLAKGRELYEEHVNRPAVTGGTRPTTRKRYRAVLDKFLAFAEGESITTWSQVNKRVLERYAEYLGELGRADNTRYLELTTLKQINKWLTEEGHLPESARIRLKLTRDKESTTYCWTDEEFAAIIAHCERDRSLVWLGQILFTLGATGMRISELAQLRWSNIDANFEHISLVDESRKITTGRARQTLKNKRGRTFSLHADLRPILKSLPRAADGLVFHGPLGGRVKPDTLRNILIKQVLTPLANRFPSAPGDKGFNDGRLHSFRHLFCSLCANSTGITERAVMVWLGHADAAMVRRYYHPKGEELRRQMDRVSIQSVKAVPKSGGEVKKNAEEPSDQAEVDAADLAQFCHRWTVPNLALVEVLILLAL